MLCRDDLGSPAFRWDVTLKYGSPLDSEIEFYETDDEAWTIPAGSTVSLVFGDPDTPIATWPGTISGNRVRFYRTIAEVKSVRNTIKLGTQVRVFTMFPPVDAEPEAQSIGMVNWQ